MMIPFNLNAKIAYITKETLQPIAKNHSITNIENFYIRMNGIAHIYFRTKEDFEERPLIKNTKKSLQKIRKQAEKLASNIDDLNEFETQWLWMAQKNIRTLPIMKFITSKNKHQSKTDLHGNPIHIEELESGGYQYSYMDTSDLRDALTAIQGYAQYGIDNLPLDKDGRKKQHGLFMLISNLEIYWTKDLGRKFTFDEHKGEGITDAFDFCLDITQALDPKVTPTQIQSQMRHVIANK